MHFTAKARAHPVSAGRAGGPGATLAAALIALLLCAAPAAAHLWHDAAEDLPAAEIEAAVAALENAAETAPEGWRPPEGAAAGGSETLAFLLLREAGRLAALSEETRRVLLTYDALRLGVLEETGAFAEDANVFAWIELVRPADAATIAPFRPRLDAWRGRYAEAPE